MDDKDIFNEIPCLYASLLECKCLCSDKSHDCFCQQFKTCLENHDGDKEEIFLLLLSVLRLCADVFLEESNKGEKVCQEIQNIIATVTKEDVFFNMIQRYLSTKDQHHSWAISKTLSSLLCCSELNSTNQTTEFIVKTLMEQSTKDESVGLIQLLSHVVSYRPRPSYCPTMGTTCQNTINTYFPSLQDHQVCIRMVVALHWNSLLKTFTYPCCVDLKKEHLFFQLWKLLIEAPLSDGLSSIFLNKSHILNFIRNGNIIRPRVNSVAVEVIIKIIFSSLKCRPWEPSDVASIENAVNIAFDRGLLDSLPKCEPEFCHVGNTSYVSSSVDDDDKLGVTSKKIIFIFFSLLAELKNKQLLYESYQKLIEFLSEKKILGPFWIINLFLGEDDLLFGIMLASLRIYMNTKNNDHTRDDLSAVESFVQLDINPHSFFIRLLHLLNFNHSELLSFLTSDETCCLLYLTEYLKVLLREPDQFVKMCDSFESSQTKVGQSLNQHRVQSKSKYIDTVSDVTEIVTNQGCGVEDTILQMDICAPNQLVSYSSSEEEIDNEVEIPKPNLLRIVPVLKNLKQSIQKLVNNNQFPYNITPFVILLNSCENLFR